MRVEKFVEILDADFYTGVPDSQLKSLCNYLMSRYGIDAHHHVIAANEGNCTALAAGYHLATGRVPVVYMQNSGEGNIINPVASLLNDKVYGIPVIFVIGWRGEPGVHDEPQHIFQGEITERLLHDLGMSTFIVRKDTSSEAAAHMARNTVFEPKRGGTLNHDKIDDFINSFGLDSGDGHSYLEASNRSYQKTVDDGGKKFLEGK